MFFTADALIGWGTLLCCMESGIWLLFLQTLSVGIEMLFSRPHHQRNSQVQCLLLDMPTETWGRVLGDHGLPPTLMQAMGY